MRRPQRYLRLRLPWIAIDEADLGSAWPRLAAVIGLLLSRSPFAVVRRIWSVVVNALKRAAARSQTHVSPECCEVVAPLVAHYDSAPAVIRKGQIGRRVAAALCSCPNPVFGSVAKAVGALSRRCYVAIQASATSRWLQRTNKNVSLNDLFATAVAAAAPHASVVCLRPYQFDSNQATEPDARIVDHCALVDMSRHCSMITHGGTER